MLTFYGTSVYSQLNFDELSTTLYIHVYEKQQLFGHTSIFVSEVLRVRSASFSVILEIYYKPLKGLE